MDNIFYRGFNGQSKVLDRLIEETDKNTPLGKYLEIVTSTERISMKDERGYLKAIKEAKNPAEIEEIKGKLYDFYQKIALRRALCFLNKKVDLMELVNEGNIVIKRFLNSVEDRSFVQFRTKLQVGIDRALKDYLEGKPEINYAEINPRIKSGCLTPEEECIKRDLEEKVNSTLEILTQREEKILKRRFGIGGKKETLEEVSNDSDITMERIRQIEVKAIRKLRKRSIKKRIIL